MTDPITCPECHGVGEHRLGTLRLLCEFCHGAGEVGGENEPAERDDSTEFDPYRDASPMREIVAESMPGCTTCFGVGTVVNVGDIRRPTMLIEAPCPACQPQRS